MAFLIISSGIPVPPVSYTHLFLYDAGQTLWQCLPLGPTGFGDSPYQAFSAFAGQPLLISPDLLLKDGLLEKDDLADVPDFNDYSVEYGNVITYKTALLRTACAHFTASEDKALHKAFNHFCRTEKDWLEDYALFMSLKAVSYTHLDVYKRQI